MLRITLLASLFAIAAVDCTCAGTPTGKHDAGPGGKEGEGEGAASEGEGASSEGEGATTGEGEGEGATCPGHQDCSTVGANCGPVSDGCGGLVECGTCPTTQFCGGGGPSQCGGSSTTTGACTPITCASVGANCGPISNGCGDFIDCGSCSGTDSCGFAGPNKCGSADISTCVKDTCATNNTQCGPVADGCGGLTDNCGSCTGTDICGATNAGQCGGNGSTCTNLCLQQVACGGNVTTSISGTVFAPNGLEPIYDALVYIPNSPGGVVDPIPDGITGQCLTCNAQASGDPLVQAVTGPDGKFTLPNAPAGNNIPIVIQLGFWRRQIKVDVTPCTNNSLEGVTGTDGRPLTALPHHSGVDGQAGQGDIPLTAMVTGQVDTLQCVLRQIGVDDTEFGNPGSGKRIQIFQENGAKFDGNTPAASAALYDSQQHINLFDQVLFACEGSPNEKSAAAQGIVQSYANAGGRVFATHYQYTWLYENDPWGCNAAPTQACGQNLPACPGGSRCSNGKCTNPTCSTAGHTVASWDPDQANNNLGNNGQSILVSNIDTSFQKGADLSAWADVVGASTAAGSNQLDVDVWRRDLDGVIAPGQRWLFANAPSGLSAGPMIEHLTFNTPAQNAADAQCGRVLFSDFHVSTASGTQNEDFPLECGQCSSNAQCAGGGSCLGTCATGVLVNQCTSNTQCQQTSGNGNDQCLNKFCNNVQNPQSLTPQEKVLEFMLFDLAACIQPDTGPPPPVCTKQQCSAGECGPIADGCGGSIDCGSCPAGQQCGLGGPSKCGGACTAETCSDQGIQCGPAGDGCGNLIQCGDCPAGQTCGGGGVHGVCGQGPCTPGSCTAANAQCGEIGDGCGGSLDCGVCPNGADQCGLQAANQCCVEATCDSLQAQCGSISDGCNHTLDCGTCPNNAPCTDNKCCVPTTCAAAGADCGSLDDGCGGSLDCGQCPTNEVCGLTTPNKCGTIGG